MGGHVHPEYALGVGLRRIGPGAGLLRGRIGQVWERRPRRDRGSVQDSRLDRIGGGPPTGGAPGRCRSAALGAMGVGAEFEDASARGRASYGGRIGQCVGATPSARWGWCRIRGWIGPGVGLLRGVHRAGIRAPPSVRQDPMQTPIYASPQSREKLRRTSASFGSVLAISRRTLSNRVSLEPSSC